MEDHWRHTGSEVRFPAQDGKLSKLKMSLPVVLRARVAMPTQKMFMSSPVNT